MSTAPRPPELRHLIEVPRFLGHHHSAVQRLQGTTPLGHPVGYELIDGWILIVFLSTACDGCHELWAAFSDSSRPPIGGLESIIVVTRGPELEALGDVARLCGDASVVMSNDAWSDYGVHAGPFFVLVDGGKARVATEGVAWSIEQIAGAVAAARGSE